jgi:endonuclease/exonuclease/phosphatase family metal-dependent hydrolase
MQIKLISYNIWHGTYLDKVIEFLKQEKADIVCIQENGQLGQAQKASNINMFAKIEEETGMMGGYAPTFGAQTAQGKFQFGVSVYSKYPVEIVKLVPYAGVYFDFPLGQDFRYVWPSTLLITKIKLPERDLLVATTHLPVTRETAVTARQLTAAKEVQEALKEYSELILCGDMNTLPNSETYKVVANKFDDWTQKVEGTLHPTIHPVGGKNFHVDYVFARGEKLEHLKTKVPLVDASDHLPIVVEFAISP